MNSQNTSHVHATSQYQQSAPRLFNTRIVQGKEDASYFCQDFQRLVNKYVTTCNSWNETRPLLAIIAMIFQYAFITTLSLNLRLTSSVVQLRSRAYHRPLDYAIRTGSKNGVCSNSMLGGHERPGRENDHRQTDKDGKISRRLHLLVFANNPEYVLYSIICFVN